MHVDGVLGQRYDPTLKVSGTRRMCALRDDVVRQVPGRVVDARAVERHAPRAGGLSPGLHMRGVDDLVHVLADDAAPRLELKVPRSRVSDEDDPGCHQSTPVVKRRVEIPRAPSMA